MKRAFVYASILSLIPALVGAADLQVSGAVDGVPTFVRGELGFIEPLPAEGLQNAHAELEVKKTAQALLRDLVVERFDAAGSEVLVPTKVRRDNLGTVHIRFAQKIGGLEVVGAGMIVHADAATGEVYAVNGNFASAKKAPAREALVPLHLARALKAAGIEGKILEGPEAVYLLSQEGDRALLTWRVRVEHTSAGGDYSNDYLFFDGATGRLVDRHATVHTAKAWTTYTANNGTSLPGTQLCTGNQSCGDTAAQDAHDNASITYDYYQAKFGRDSLNGAGFHLRSTVHYSTNYNNAFWDGSQMVYGDGDGTTFSPLSGSLDVVAHELTHGVTEFESNLIYARESGAINEALSDIFGVAAEAWSDGAITADTWRLGEDIYTPNGPSTDALRYMNDPTADGYSKDYYPSRLYPGTCVPNSTNDQCGVHGNSGIANLAFYLMVVGGTHPGGATSNSVPAIGMSKAEQIFYRAQTTYLTSSSDFAALRTATAQAATDLYGSSDAGAVHDAWCAVGVPGCPATGGGSLANGVPETGLSGSTGTNTFYTIEIPAGATNLSVNLSGGSGDADLYVRFGSQPTTSTYDCRSWASGNTESCSFASPSAGTYHVMVRAYSTYSGASLTATWTEPSGGCSSSGAANGLSGAAGSEARYTWDAPACATTVTISISGGSGDADLYVRFGSQPTTSTYDCRPYKNGNNETCTFTPAGTGTYHIMVRGYTSYSGVDLTADYE